MSEMIVVLIPLSGPVKIEAQGFVGASCEEATRALQEALGKTVADERRPEYFETEKEKAVE